MRVLSDSNMESICHPGSLEEKCMNDNIWRSIRESYDRVSDEYALRIFNELQHKPLDRELLNRFAAQIKERGVVCDTCSSHLTAC